MPIRTIFSYRHPAYSAGRLSGCLESGMSMTLDARGLPAALHEPPPLALAPRPACSAGGGDGATGITATGDASPTPGSGTPRLIPDDDADYTAR
jgi:hypothetical protein